MDAAPCCRPRPLSQAATPRPAVDVVWMHNGWEMIVPMMQRRLAEIEPHACPVNLATMGRVFNKCTCAATDVICKLISQKLYKELYKRLYTVIAKQRAVNSL